MDASLEFCKNNKPKLYELIEQGKTKNLPGIDLEYEVPVNAKLVFNPKENETNLDKILKYLGENKVFPLQ